MEHFNFTTTAVDSSRAVSYWADEVLPTLDASLIGANTGDFACDLVGRRYGGVSIARAALSSYSGIWRENARRIGTADSLTIFRVKSGKLWLKTRNEQEYSLGAGEAFVSGPEALTHYSIAPGREGARALEADMTTIPLPRLEEHSRFFQRNLARPLPPTSSGNIVNTFVEALRCPDTPDSEFVHLINSFTELVAVALGSWAGPLQRQARDDVYYRALAHMRSHHTDNGLTIESMAKALGVSERALFAAFDDKELTPHKYINKLRIDTAKSLLCGNEARSNIMDVALSSGFDSLSTFNRQFRAHAGVSPSEYRAGARMRRGEATIDLTRAAVAAL